MQQTLLAFLAMLMLMIFASSQQRSILGSYMNVYGREFEMVATDLALKRMARLSDLRYDNGFSNDDLPASSAGMYAPIGSDTGDLGRNDIDDYDGYTEEGYEHEMNGQTYKFDLGISVRFVNLNNLDVTTTAKTHAKEVTVTITDEESGQTYVQLSRVYTAAGRFYR